MTKEGQFTRAAREALAIVPADEGRKMLHGGPPEDAQKRLSVLLDRLVAFAENWTTDDYFAGWWKHRGAPAVAKRRADPAPTTYEEAYGLLREVELYKDVLDVVAGKEDEEAGWMIETTEMICREHMPADVEDAEIKA